MDVAGGGVGGEGEGVRVEVSTTVTRRLANRFVGGILPAATGGVVAWCGRKSCSGCMNTGFGTVGLLTGEFFIISKNFSALL